MFKYKILIVLYNKIPEESETIVSLSDLKDNINDLAEILIWDNSIKSLSCQDLNSLGNLFSGFKYEYRSDGKNTPLSVIYNSVIKELNEDQILIIFDHDSVINNSYFDTLFDADSKHSAVNLFLPIIKYDGVIVSPANLWYFKGSYWNEAKYGLVESKHKSAINSGMAIRAKYLIDYFEGYNENIFFYGTDSDFMQKYSKQNEYFYVLNTVINHTLNFFDNKDIEDKIKRYKEMRRASLIRMRQENIAILVLANIYFLFYSFKLAFSFRDYRFI